MAHRKTSKRSKARRMLRLADLEQSKSRFFTRSAQRVRKNHTVMPTTSLSGGIAPNRVFHLTELSSFATGSFSNKRTLHPPPSMCGSPP
jgi:hypothetical protein